MSNHPFARRQGTRHGLIMALVAFLALGGLVAAQQADLAAPSPASGHQQVIAQGMSAPTESRMVWRAVERAIPTRADARASDRLADGPGFLLATDKALFVTDQRTKLRTRLGGGEAVFVSPGANQTWASLDTKATTAMTLELVARSQYKETTGKDRLVYNSRSFEMTNGDYDLDLIRDTLATDETGSLTASAYPVLFYVTSGQIEVSSDDADTGVSTVGAGEGKAFRGNLTIRGTSEEPATYVVAIVGTVIGGGGAVPKPTETSGTPTEEPTKAAEETPTPEPTTAPTGTASLLLYIRACPAGMVPATIDIKQCTYLPGGYDLLLVQPDGSVLGLDSALFYDSQTIAWQGLQAGTYQLLINAYPPGYNDVSLDTYVCCSVPGGFALTVDDNSQLVGVLYFFLPASAVQPPTNPQPGTDRTDSDGDGLSDYDEVYVYGTDPYNGDSDGDGVNDSNEVAYGSNPLDPLSYP